MHSRRQWGEFGATIALGLLSTDMVLVIGHLGRHQPLGDTDRKTLKDAQDLFRRLSVETPGVSVAYVDEATMRVVFEAVRRQAPAGSIPAYLRAQARILARASGDRPISVASQPQLFATQNLFARIGELALAQSNDLS